MHTFKTLRLCSLLLLAATVANAAVPNLINYQGLLTDSNGFALPGTTTKNFTLKIFPSQLGGSDIYSESFQNVTVDKGVYSFAFGSGITSSLLSANGLWLELSVDGVAQSSRERLLSVPYALKAEEANSVAPGSVTPAGLEAGAALANLSASGFAAVPTGGIIMSANLNSTLSSMGFTNIGSMPLPGTEVSMALPTANRPNFAPSHVFWRGLEMITVGFDPSYTDKFVIGKFNKQTKVWTTYTQVSTHLATQGYSAVLAGNRIIVWGGYTQPGGLPTFYNTGFIFDIDTGGVTNTASGANVPSPRTDHGAVWTGDKMIIWGGVVHASGVTSNLNTGAIYNPSNGGSWETIEQNGVTPGDIPTAREDFRTFWVGTKFIVWGGEQANPFTVLHDGYMFDTSSNLWQKINDSTNAPTNSGSSPICSTGTELLVWNWGPNSKRLNPAANTWQNMSYQGAPPAPSGSVRALWNGTEMTLSAPALGYTYNPTDDKWIVRTGAGVSGSLWTGDGFIGFDSFQQLGKAYYLYQKN